MEDSDRCCCFGYFLERPLFSIALAHEPSQASWGHCVSQHFQKHGPSSLFADIVEVAEVPEASGSNLEANFETNPTSRDELEHETKDDYGCFRIETVQHVIAQHDCPRKAILTTVRMARVSVHSIDVKNLLWLDRIAHWNHRNCSMTHPKGAHFGSNFCASCVQGSEAAFCDEPTMRTNGQTLRKSSSTSRKNYCVVWGCSSCDEEVGRPSHWMTTSPGNPDHRRTWICAHRGDAPISIPVGGTTRWYALHAESSQGRVTWLMDKKVYLEEILWFRLNPWLLKLDDWFGNLQDAQKSSPNRLFPFDHRKNQHDEHGAKNFPLKRRWCESSPPPSFWRPIVCRNERAKNEFRKI